MDGVDAILDTWNDGRAASDSVLVGDLLVQGGAHPMSLENVYVASREGMRWCLSFTFLFYVFASLTRMLTCGKMSQHVSSLNLVPCVVADCRVPVSLV